MRHRVAYRKLGRVTEHRIALLRGLSRHLLRHERIHTTVPKAKELRPFVERLISIAKRSLGDGGNPARQVTARRLVLRDLQDRELVAKLFSEIAPRYRERPGGYTRLIRTGYRRGDSAELAMVELLGSEFNPKAAAEKTKDKDADKEKGKATPAAEKPKGRGVGDRLRAATDRIRGKKTAEDDTEAAARIRGKKVAEQTEDAAAAAAEVKSQARAAARKGSGGSRRAPGGRGAKGNK